MKHKKESIVLVLMIVALTAYLVLHDTDRTRYRLPDISDLRADRMTKIEIEKSGQSVVLNKIESKWGVGTQGYRADSGKIDRLLDVLATLAVTDLVSESESYTRYDLSPDQKISVTAWIGDTPVRQFDIGKTSSTFRHTYIKLKKNSNVYHARGNFRNAFDHPAAYFRDLTVLSFEKKDVQEVHIARADRSVVVSRRTMPSDGSVKAPEKSDEAAPSETAGAWQRDDGKVLKASTLDALLSVLSNLTCQKYLSDRTSADFKKPICSISLKGTGDFFLSVFDREDKEAGAYPAVSSIAESPFMLSDSKVDRITSQIEAVFKIQ